MARFRFALAAIFALAMAVAACSDKETDGEGAGTPRSGDAQPTPTRSLDGLDSLRRFAESLGQDTYRLVYEMTGSDAKGQELEATLAMSADPPRQSIGLSGEFEGKKAAFILINDGKASYVCAETDGLRRCLKGQSLATSTIPLPALLDVESLIERVSADTGAKVKPAKDQRIAGQDGKCWEIEGAEGKGTFCVSEKDGVLLLMDGDFDGASFTMKAKEIGQPSAKDFEPPFRVVEFGN